MNKQKRFNWRLVLTSVVPSLLIFVVVWGPNMFLFDRLSMNDHKYDDDYTVWEFWTNVGLLGNVFVFIFIFNVVYSWIDMRFFKKSKVDCKT